MRARAEKVGGQTDSCERMSLTGCSASLFVIGLQDRGGQYRSALGLPGGISGPFAAAWKKAAESNGMQLVEGKGNEGDTLKDKSIYVYDTKAFPFYPGEVNFP